MVIIPLDDPLTLWERPAGHLFEALSLFLLETAKGLNIETWKPDEINSSATFSLTTGVLVYRIFDAEHGKWRVEWYGELGLQEDQLTFADKQRYV